MTVYIMYVTVNKYNHTYILGIFDTRKEAEDSYITYLNLQKHSADMAETIMDDMSEEFELDFEDKPNTFETLRQYIFGTIDDVDDELNYGIYIDWINEYGIGCDIHYVDWIADLANIINEYNNWILIDNYEGINHLERMLSFYGYNFEGNPSIEYLADNFPVTLSPK